MNKFKNIVDIEEFKEDYDSLTIDKILSKYKLDPKTVFSYAKRLGVNRKQGSRRVNKVNDSYFSSSNNTANKYYILGMIYTDGNLPIKNKNSFIISNINLQLLEDIKKELNFTGPITIEYHKKFDKSIYKLQVTSEQIRRDLEFIGLTPNKTFNLKFPDVPKEYLRDFIRGLWDGDGSVGRRGKEDRMLTSSFACANLDFINTVTNYLPVNKKKVYTGKNIFFTSFSNKDSLKIREFLYYEDCLCMKRKQNIFFS